MIGVSAHNEGKLLGYAAYSIQDWNAMDDQIYAELMG